MTATSRRAGLYFALLQLFFTLCWTVYAIYLPALAAQAGLPPGAVILLLMADQAVFTVVDFATGVAADRVSGVLGRVGYWVAGVSAVSCVAFLALPFIVPAGAGAFIAVTMLWAVTSSALRAPPLMLLGKYAAKPTIPYLSSLAMVGYGVAGALAPYLAIELRGVDPRLPFVLSSAVLLATALGLTWVERQLAGQAPAQRTAPPARGSISKAAAVFALAVIVLALGYQLHFAINSAPAFLRFAPQTELEWLMPVFWIGFNIAMFPAGKLANRFGAYTVMAGSALLGGIAILATAVAGNLELLTAAQFAAGAAWGCILVAAFTVAFAVGDDGREGAMAGVLFSALALATLARMGLVAGGLAADPGIRAVLLWAPTLCWVLAGIGMFYGSTLKLRAR
jgi:hypothetical protein